MRVYSQKPQLLYEIVSDHEIGSYDSVTTKSWLAILILKVKRVNFEFTTNFTLFYIELLNNQRWSFSFGIHLYCKFGVLM